MTDTNDFAARAKIAAKIRGLLAKTEANGCSEDEAMAAAMAARRLMDKHGLDQTEAELLEDGFDGQDSSNPDDAESEMIQSAFQTGIGAFTETMTWRNVKVRRAWEVKQADLFASTSAKPIKTEQAYKTVHFFGFQSDVIFAVWLAETLEGFVRRNAAQFIADFEGGIRRQGRRRSNSSNGMGFRSAHRPSMTYADVMHKRVSFAIGAAQQINERLHEEARKRRTEQGRGAGLIVVNRKSLIESEMTRRGIVLHAGKQEGRAIDGAAFKAGVARGNTATFDRPVNQGRGMLAIGG